MENLLEPQEKIMSDMVEQYASLNDSQRGELLRRFAEFFCRYCGRKIPRYGCHCENDE